MAVTTHKELRRIVVFALMLLLFFLAYVVLKPIILSIIGGLLLAYVLMPIYKKIFGLLKERNTSALAVCVILVLIIFIPLWFIIPLIIQQAFEIFNFSQTLDIRGFVDSILAGAPQSFKQELSSALITFIGTIASGILSRLTSFLVEIPNLLLHAAVVLFVFFFTLRDGDKLAAYISNLAPLKKHQQRVIAKQFQGITSSIMFGYVIVGVIQGIATGIGMLIFGVPRALLLTIVAIFASIFPVFGPWLVWVPAAIYLIAQGNMGMAIGFILYSALFVSSIDNIMRPYIVSRKTGTSSVIVLVGMIGGLLVFGILGIILGPLILSYIVLFLDAYRNRTLSEMFDQD